MAVVIIFGLLYFTPQIQIQQFIVIILVEVAPIMLGRLDYSKKQFQNY